MHEFKGITVGWSSFLSSNEYLNKGGKTMKGMKKLLCVLLAGAMIMGLCACGKTGSGKSGKDDDDDDRGGRSERTEDEDEDDDDDFMSSFCAFADKIRNMGVFEKMKLNGNTVSEISFEDLAKEAKLQLEKKRSKV